MAEGVTAKIFFLNLTLYRCLTTGSSAPQYYLAGVWEQLGAFKNIFKLGEIRKKLPNNWDMNDRIIRDGKKIFYLFCIYFIVVSNSESVFKIG